MNTKVTADEIVRALGLQPLVPEGGFFLRTYRSDLVITGSDGDRAIATAIYYLITDDNFSALHRLKSTEIYHFYYGAPVELSLLSPEGDLQQIILGSQIPNGQVPQAIIPPGVWQASQILNADEGVWALLGTTVSPGFEFEDFELAARADMTLQFPQHADLVTRLTRA